MSDQYEDLQQSYGRCLRDKHFIERFYQTFLASSPAIPPMFQTTDFNKQRMALRHPLPQRPPLQQPPRLRQRHLRRLHRPPHPQQHLLRPAPSMSMSPTLATSRTWP